MLEQSLLDRNRESGSGLDIGHFSVEIVNDFLKALSWDIFAENLWYALNFS